MFVGDSPVFNDFPDVNYDQHVVVSSLGCEEVQRGLAVDKVLCDGRLRLIPLFSFFLSFPTLRVSEREEARRSNQYLSRC